MSNVSAHDYKMFRTIFYVTSILPLIVVFVLIAYNIHPFPIVLKKEECSFLTELHLYCPGCGGTRALQAFLQLHFFQSLKYNPMVVFAASFSASFYAQGFYTFVIKKDNNLHFLNNIRIGLAAFVIYLIYIVARDVLLAYGIYDCLGT